MSNDRTDEIISVRVADKEKCPCAKCKWGVLLLAAVSSLQSIGEMI